MMNQSGKTPPMFRFGVCQMIRKMSKVLFSLIFTRASFYGMTPQYIVVFK
jgi:hypothetical protein